MNKDKLDIFEQVFREVSVRVELDQLRRQLTADEAKIAVRYLKNLIGTRPMPKAPEDRAYMATFELEGDPK